MKYDYQFKQTILESGIYQEYCTAFKQVLKGDNSARDSFINAHGLKVYKACKSLSNSKYNQRKKIRQRFNLIVEKEKAVFLTLTFTDETLAKTSAETRSKYVKRYLKEQCARYVANLDYGSQKGREHYHALIMPRNGSIDLKAWKYGTIDCKRVRNTQKDTEKVARYVAKLSNHALKNTGKMPRVIFSRGWLDTKQYYDDNLETLPF